VTEADVAAVEGEVETSAPVENEPAEVAAAPVDDAAAPDEDAAAPVDDAAAPVEDAAPSVEDEAAPIGMPRPQLRAAVEAVLMVVDAPVTEVELATACRCTALEVSSVLHELAAEYRRDGRGFDLRESGGGWRFWSSALCADVVERFVRDGQQAKLTQAALETLAVVAYRQPVTRSRVAAVRGVNVDGVMRTLLTRGLVEEAGTEEGSGATLYRTTAYFLDRLGIDSLDELPDIAPFLPGIDALDDVEMPGT
jgi:segregation and condensation protein B